MASNDPQVSSICLIKNVTGGALTFLASHDFDGRIGAITYPQEIPTGRWAEFVHSGYDGTAPESIGAVVYRCKNPDGQHCDWIVAWLNIYGDNSRKVYTVINPVGGNYDCNSPIWSEILKKLNRGGCHSEATWENCKATLDVVRDDDCDAFAIFQGIITAKGN